MRTWAVYCRDVDQVLAKANLNMGELVTVMPDTSSQFPGPCWALFRGHPGTEETMRIHGAKQRPRWTFNPS